MERIYRGNKYEPDIKEIEVDGLCRMGLKLKPKCPYCDIPIREHPANRCLNVVFCEKVLGWEEIEYWEEKTEILYPSTNISDAMEGEVLVKKEPRERKARYCGILERIIAYDLGYPEGSVPIELEFECICATPHQRTRALVMWAMEKGG